MRDMILDFAHHWCEYRREWSSFLYNCIGKSANSVERGDRESCRRPSFNQSPPLTCVSLGYSFSPLRPQPVFVTHASILLPHPGFSDCWWCTEWRINVRQCADRSETSSIHLREAGRTTIVTHRASGCRTTVPRDTYRLTTLDILHQHTVHVHRRLHPTPTTQSVMFSFQKS